MAWALGQKTLPSPTHTHTCTHQQPPPPQIHPTSLHTPKRRQACTAWTAIKPHLQQTTLPPALPLTCPCPRPPCSQHTGCQTLRGIMGTGKVGEHRSCGMGWGAGFRGVVHRAVVVAALARREMRQGVECGGGGGGEGGLCRASEWHTAPQHQGWGASSALVTPHTHTHTSPGIQPQQGEGEG